MCESQFSWQARYLVRDFWCSARCAGRFTCDEDRSCESFFVAGAVFGEGGG